MFRLQNLLQDTRNIGDHSDYDVESDVEQCPSLRCYTPESNCVSDFEGSHLDRKKRVDRKVASLLKYFYRS